jgi:hypothetical protein
MSFERSPQHPKRTLLVAGRLAELGSASEELVLSGLEVPLSMRIMDLI